MDVEDARRALSEEGSRIRVGKGADKQVGALVMYILVQRYTYGIGKVGTVGAVID